MNPIIPALLAATLAGCASVGPPGHVYETGLVNYEDSHILRMKDGAIYIKYGVDEPMPTVEQQNLWINQAFNTGVIDDNERRAAGRHSLRTAALRSPQKYVRASP